MLAYEYAHERVVKVALSCRRVLMPAVLRQVEAAVVVVVRPLVRSFGRSPAS